jgi:energy-coupling factor transporter ATP-binding protein EcfA2
MTNEKFLVDKIMKSFPDWIASIAPLKETNPSFSEVNVTSLHPSSEPWSKYMHTAVSNLIDHAFTAAENLGKGPDYEGAQKWVENLEARMESLSLQQKSIQKRSMMRLSLRDSFGKDSPTQIMKFLFEYDEGNIIPKTEKDKLLNLTWLKDYIQCALEDFSSIKAYGDAFHLLENDAKDSQNIYSKIVSHMNMIDVEDRITHHTIAICILCHLFSCIYAKKPFTESDCIELRDEINKIVSKGTDTPYRKQKMLERIHRLEWGPENYHRNPNFIKKAHLQLKKNQILGLVGIGGVGKTALAQKLMLDLIHQDEYDYYVPWTSKLGSEQGTIDLKHGGTTATSERHTPFYSMYDADSSKLSFRWILTNILTSIPSHAGVNYSARDENELIELTLDLLSRNKVLLLIDNYEDIEDNTSDPYIQKLHGQFTNFFNRFSGSDTNSKIIITTRGDADTATSRLDVEFLNLNETVELFRKKIGSLAAHETESIEKKEMLQHIHIGLSPNGEFRGLIEKQFEAWPSSKNEEITAHPSLILGAAYDIADSNEEHVKEVLKEWGEGNSKRDGILEYATSRTISNFQEWEVKLIKGMCEAIGVNKTINATVIGDIYLPEWNADHGFTEKERHSFLRKLKRRQFLVDSEADDREYIWNVQMLLALNQRFNIKKLVTESQPLYETHLPIRESEKLDNFKSFFDKIAEWLEQEVDPKNEAKINSDYIADITYYDTVKKFRAFREFISNEYPSFEAQQKTPIPISLDQGLVNGIKSANSLLNHMVSLLKSDKALGRFAGGNKHNPLEVLFQQIENLINIFQLLIKRAELSPELTSSLSNYYLMAVVRIFDLLSQIQSEVGDKIDTMRLRTIILEDIIRMDHQLSFTADVQDRAIRSHRINLILVQYAEVLKIHNCKLADDGLKLSETQVKYCQLWLSGCRLVRSYNSRTDLIQQYKFWFILRMFATSIEVEGQNLNELSTLRQDGKQLRQELSHSIINQYIVKVENSQDIHIDYRCRTPAQLVDRIRIYDQTPKGTPIMVENLQYDPIQDRYTHKFQDLRNQNWVVIVPRSRNQLLPQTDQGPIFLLINRLNLQDKRITCQPKFDGGKFTTLSKEDYDDYEAETKVPKKQPKPGTSKSIAYLSLPHSSHLYSDARNTGLCLPKYPSLLKSIFEFLLKEADGELTYRKAITKIQKKFRKEDTQKWESKPFVIMMTLSGAISKEKRNDWLEQPVDFGKSGLSLVVDKFFLKLNSKAYAITKNNPEIKNLDKPLSQYKKAIIDSI